MFHIPHMALGGIGLDYKHSMQQLFDSTYQSTFITRLTNFPLRLTAIRYTIKSFAPSSSQKPILLLLATSLVRTTVRVLQECRLLQPSPHNIYHISNNFILLSL